MNVGCSTATTHVENDHACGSILRRGFFVEFQCFNVANVLRNWALILQVRLNGLLQKLSAPLFLDLPRSNKAAPG